MTMTLAASVRVGAEQRAQAATPPRVTLSMKEATAAEAATALSQALGVPVSAAPVDGPAARATLELLDVSPLEALERVATAFSGRWQPVYHVIAATERGSSPLFNTGRQVSLDVENALPRAALMPIVLADGGILATPPAAEEPRITVKLENAPVEVGMDRVTAELGLAWTRTFQIIPGKVPVVPQPSDPATSSFRSPPRAEPLVPLVEPDRPAEGPTGAAPPTRAPDLARALSDGLVRLMQMDPQVRGGAIREFAQQVERGLRQINALSAAERSHHRTQIARVYQSGMRLYRGLTPDQQREFRPFFDVLRRWLSG